MPLIVDPAASGAVVNPQAIILNLASDPSDYQAFGYPDSFAPALSVPGEIRVGASGRERSFTRAGRSTVMPVSLPQVPRAQIDWLRSHVGELMCVRDDRGGKFFGTFYEVPVDESTMTTAYGDVSLQFRSVTFSEAV